MEKIRFTQHILAGREKVWDTLWSIDSYRNWTTAFTEGSDVQTDNWQEGSKVLFLDGKGNGIASRVAANQPATFMSFQHLGVVKNGVEDNTVTDWSGAHENYTLANDGDGTLLTVEMDSVPELKAYLEKTWPLAMQKIKQLAEQN